MGIFLVLRGRAHVVFCLQIHSNPQIVSSSNAATRRQYACYRVCTSLFCLAYATASKKSTYALRVQLFALATCAIIDGKRLRARLGALPRYLKRTHALRNHIFGETDAPAALVRGARQPHGMKFGQRSLKHIDRTAPFVRGARPPHRMSARSKHINRTARRRQRPWLHDRAALAPVRGLRGERLA